MANNSLIERSESRIKYIIIHCTGAPEKSASKQTVESIRNYHVKSKGWPDIGYHYVITTDGVWHVGREIKYVGCHTEGFNTTGIGIAYCGGCGATQNQCKDTRTDAQKTTLYNQVKSLLIQYHDRGQNLTVHGHYEYAQKGCPSFNVEQWLIDTGLTTEFPWLEEGSNMKMYRAGKEVISSGNGYKGGGCVIKSSGVNPVTSKVTDDTQLTSNQSYTSPYKSQRDELTKRISASTSNNINYLSNNNFSAGSLFASPFYYLQNGYDSSHLNTTDKDRIKYVKCLLYLHTLPWDYNAVRCDDKFVGFFNNSDSTHGGVELVPSGWIYLLGGMVWRNDFYVKNKYDPISFGYTRKGSDNSDEYVALYKAPTGMYTPLLVKKDGKYEFTVISGTETQEYADSNYTMYNLYNPYMDYYVRNSLKEAFIEFADKYYPVIESLELSVNSYGDISLSSETTDEVTYAKEESEILQKAPIKTETMTYVYCKNLVNTLSGKTLNIMLNVLCGKKLYKYDGSTYGSLKGFSGHYSMGFYASRYNGVYLYYSESYKPVEDLYNMTYGAPLIVCTNSGNKLSRTSSNEYSIYDKNYKSYLEGFCNTLVYYVKNNAPTVSTGSGVSTVVRDDERDFKTEIYLYLKNLWDRWLCGFYFSDSDTNNHYFHVNTFFHNFVFIDTFYNNIGTKLRLNCNHLLEQYTGGDSSTTNSGKSVINHLGNVVSKHQCVLFNFPDYVDFCGSTGDGGKLANTNVKNMFVPQPTFQIGNPSITNKFVIIYTHTANFLETNDRNKFIPDTFDIWSSNEGTGVAPSVFNYSLADRVNATDPVNPENKMAYKVPAFGVAYSRQDNSYWKDIKVGMDTQTMTEQAARAEANVAEKGNSNKKKLCFYGQDIYSIYQAYSYIVTIEMMGCAQIQPLMYFQLMNIPMFRGTYMVIKVEHHLRAGDMTTTFTGMKMSKVQKPFTTSWFTIPSTYESEDDTVNYDTATNGSVIQGSDGVQIDIEDNNLSDAINKYIGKEMLCDVFVRNVYKDLGVTVNNNLAYGSDNKNMFTEMSTNGEWNVKMFKKLPKKSNNWQSLSSTSSHPDVGEVLFGYHNGKFGESTDGNTIDKHMHVAIYLGLHNGKHYIVEGADSEADKSKTGISNNKVRVSSIDTSMMSESGDVYTHHAKCTKITIEQYDASKSNKTTETTATETSSSSTSTPASTTSTGQPGETIKSGNLVAIEITKPIRFLMPSGPNEVNPTVSDLNASTRWGNGSVVSQAALTSGNRDVVGTCVVSDGFSSTGIVHVGKSTNSGGFIQYSNGSYKFAKTYSEYMQLITMDAIGGAREGAMCQTIIGAFQAWPVILSGNKNPGVLKGKTREEMYVFRNIAVRKDGKLFFTVSDGPCKIDDWEDKLVKAGFVEAVYMDCGGNWQYGFYKIGSGMRSKITKGKVENNVWYWAGSVKTGYKGWSNFIVF